MKKHFDKVIFLCLILLAALSIFTLLGINRQLVASQLLYFFIGFFFLFLFYFLGVNFFQLNKHIAYWGLFTVLVFTSLFGEEIRGSRRWIDLYFFKFQASEFLKVFFILYCADFFKNRRVNILIAAFIFIPTIFIVSRQPDLGSAIVYLTVLSGIIFFAGFPLRYFTYVVIVCAAGVPLVWRGLAEYQRNRILSFIQPSLDPAGISYNLIQSIITVGSGGFWGRGLGRGTQSRFLFLPENTTDFAYASLVEQFGFVAGLAVILLYGLIIYRMVRKLMVVRERSFYFLFLAGSVILITTQVGMNIGMNVGLLPVAGIPLPLISYGGSSIVSTMMLFGLMMSF